MLNTYTTFNNNMHKNFKIIFSFFVGFYLIFNMADLFTIIKYHKSLHIDDNSIIAYGIYFMSQLIVIFHFLTKNNNEIQSKNEKSFDIILLINKIFIDPFLLFFFNVNIKYGNETSYSSFVTIMNYFFVVQWCIMTLYILCMLIGTFFCCGSKNIYNDANDYKERFLV